MAVPKLNKFSLFHYIDFRAFKYSGDDFGSVHLIASSSGIGLEQVVSENVYDLTCFHVIGIS